MRDTAPLHRNEGRLGGEPYPWEQSGGREHTPKHLGDSKVTASGEHIVSDPNLRPYTAKVPLLVRPSFLSESISSNTATVS